MVFKHKTGSKLLATVLITGGLLSSLTVVSNADQTIDNSNVNTISEKAIAQTRAVQDSDPRSFTVDGRKCSNIIRLRYSTNNVSATTCVTSSRVENPKVLGAHCNLYNSSGKVVKTADWSYNTKPSKEHSSFTGVYTKNGTYFAKGTTRVFDGKQNKYVTVGANQTKSVIARSVNISQEEIEKRERIYETYKMVPAVGVDNTEGYVLEDDLFGDMPETIDDVVMTKSGVRMIPLYDEDCKTVIGEYRVGL